MNSFEYYVVALPLALIVACMVTMIPAGAIAWVTAEWIDGVTSGRLIAAASWTWLVATVAVAWLYLLGLGVIHLQLQGAELYFYGDMVAMMTVGAFIVGLFVSYRSTRRYLLRCVELRFDPKLAAEVQRARKGRFSLRSLILCQVLGIASLGLWLECHRDSVERQVAAAVERRAENAWRHHLSERNFEQFHWHTAIGGGPEHWLSLTAAAPQPLVNDEVLELIEAGDRIQVLSLRSDGVTDKGLRTLATFHTLRELSIESARVTDKGVAELVRLQQLERLTLKCPQVTEQALAAIDCFPAKTLITVESEQIASAVAQSYWQAHSNVCFPSQRCGGSRVR